jgi:hypothetical protein
MGKCGNKITQTCGITVEDACTKYNGTVNPTSVLINDRCLTLGETTQDLYSQVGQLTLENDLSDLGTKCLTYVKVGGKTFVKNVLLKHEQEICDLKVKILKLETTAFCEMKIVDCGLNLKCLLPANPCNTTIITVKDLFQALINKVCP